MTRTTIIDHKTSTESIVSSYGTQLKLQTTFVNYHTHAQIFRAVTEAHRGNGKQPTSFGFLKTTDKLWYDVTATRDVPVSN